MQISPREKRLIVGGVVVLLVLFFWNMLTPSNGGKSMAGQVPLAKALKDTELNRHNETRFAREVSEMDPKIAALAFDIPPDALVPQTVKELQTIATKAGVHIREVKPVRPRLLPSGLGASVPLEVHFQAPFQPNAMKFFYFVEEPETKMVLDKLDITSADPRKKTVEVSAQVTVYTKAVAGASNSDTGTGDKSNAIN